METFSLKFISMEFQKQVLFNITFISINNDTKLKWTKNNDKNKLRETIKAGWVKYNKNIMSNMRYLNVYYPFLAIN